MNNIKSVAATPKETLGLSGNVSNGKVNPVPAQSNATFPDFNFYTSFSIDNRPIIFYILYIPG